MTSSSRPSHSIALSSVWSRCLRPVTEQLSRATSRSSAGVQRFGTCMPSDFLPEKLESELEDSRIERRRRQHELARVLARVRTRQVDPVERVEHLEPELN